MITIIFANVIYCECQSNTYYVVLGYDNIMRNVITKLVHKYITYIKYITKLTGCHYPSNWIVADRYSNLVHRTPASPVLVLRGSNFDRQCNVRRSLEIDNSILIVNTHLFLDVTIWVYTNTTEFSKFIM